MKTKNVLPTLAIHSAFQITNAFKNRPAREQKSIRSAI